MQQKRVVEWIVRFDEWEVVEVAAHQLLNAIVGFDEWEVVEVAADQLQTVLKFEPKGADVRAHTQWD